MGALWHVCKYQILQHRMTNLVAVENVCVCLCLCLCLCVPHFVNTEETSRTSEVNFGSTQLTPPKLPFTKQK